MTAHRSLWMATLLAFLSGMSASLADASPARAAITSAAASEVAAERSAKFCNHDALANFRHATTVASNVIEMVASSPAAEGGARCEDVLRTGARTAGLRRASAPRENGQGVALTSSRFWCPWWQGGRAMSANTAQQEVVRDLDPVVVKNHNLDERPRRPTEKERVDTRKPRKGL